MNLKQGLLLNKLQASDSRFQAFISRFKYLAKNNASSQISIILFPTFHFYCAPNMIEGSWWGKGFSVRSFLL
jgi:hypothetical protein